MTVPKTSSRKVKRDKRRFFITHVINWFRREKEGSYCRKASKDIPNNLNNNYLNYLIFSFPKPKNRENAFSVTKKGIFLLIDKEFCQKCFSEAIKFRFMICYNIKELKSGNLFHK